MTRQFVVRGETPKEDPPTEFWLEKDYDGDIALRVAKAGSTATILWLLRGGAIIRNNMGTEALRAMGLCVNASGEMALNNEDVA